MDRNGNIRLLGGGQIKNARVELLASDPSSPLEGQMWVNTTSFEFKGYLNASVQVFATGNSLKTISDKVTAIIAALGFNSDGSFKAFTGTNYLDAGTSVANLFALVDAQLKANADAIAAEATTRASADTTNANAIAQEVTDRTAADTTLQGNIDAEAATRATADTTNANAIAAEATTRASADTTLQGNIDAEAATRASADTALDTRLAAVEGAFVNKNGTVAFTGDQSFGGNKATNVATPTAAGDAANKDYVDTKISALGTPLHYAGTVTPGVDAAHAFDLSTLPDQSVGAFYKCISSGYLKQTSEGVAFPITREDDLYKNPEGTWDTIQGVDTIVNGTANYVTVSGNLDVGYTVDIDAAFKARMSAVETGLSQEVTDRTAADTALQANISAEAATRASADTTNANDIAAEAATRASADTALQASIEAEASTRAGADTTNANAISAEATTRANADTAIQTEVDAIESAVGLATDGTLVPFTGTNYLNSATSVVNAEVKLDAALKVVSDKVDNSSFLYTSSAAATEHTVTHNLGKKYVNVVVVDSSDNRIGVDNIHFDSETALTITVLSAINIKAFVSL